MRDQDARRFAILFSGRERAAGRLVRKRPAHAVQKAPGAVLEDYGWTHPLRFAVPGEPDEETAGFTRQN